MTNVTILLKKNLFLVLLLFSTTALRAQVHFETGSTDALHQKALRTGLPVFIDLYADWCLPCQMMKREVFSKREVADFLEKNFIAAKYNIDNPIGHKLMERYGSGSIPLFLVFSPEGELLGRMTGAFEAEALIMNLQRILNRASMPATRNSSWH